MLIGTLAVMAGSVVKADQPSSALTNPGFEAPYTPAVSTSHGISGKATVTGEIAKGWSDNSSWAPVVVHYSEASGLDAHSGDSAQQIAIESMKDGRLQFVQPVQMKAGEAYRGSMWLRASGFVTATLSFQMTKKPYRAVSQQHIVISPEWREYSVSGMSKEGERAFFMLGIPKLGDSSATIWVDDASVKNMGDAGSEAPPREGNLLNNGSFETELSGGWGVWVREYNYLQDAIRTEFQDDRPSFDTETKVDGVQSLRIDVPDARAALVASPFVPYHFNREHTASIMLKASRPTMATFYIDGVPDSQKRIMIEKEWKRFSVSAELPYGEMTRFVLRLWPDKATTIWADAAQIEEKPEATEEYIAAWPVELGINVTRPGGIVFDGEAAPVLITTGGEPLPEGAHLSWEVHALKGENVTLPDLALPATTVEAPQSRMEYEIEPSAEGPRGMFMIRGKVVDAEGNDLSAPVEAIFARLPQPRELPAEKSFFGAHCHLTPELIEILRGTGFRWVRLHDTSNLTKWRYVEENKGEFVFQDEGIDAARAAGLQILGMLDGAPPWAMKEPRALLGNHSVYNLPDIPNAYEYWARYVDKTVEHYKGRVDYWEVWNEPWANESRFGLSSEMYADLLMYAYDAAKDANPESVIVGVNSVAHSKQGDDFTAGVLAITGLDYFDIFSVHNYNPSLYGGHPSQADKIVEKFDGYMAKYGEPKPIWDTEGGPGVTTSWYWANEDDEMMIRQQMAHLVRFDVTQMAAGIERFFYYSIYFHQSRGAKSGFPTVEHDRSIHPVMAVSAVLASLVDGATSKGYVTPQDGIEGYRFVQDDGMDISVLWSVDGSVQEYLKQKDTEVWDVLGNSLDSSTIPLSVEPIYVIRKQP
ncbi:endo-1,4-beta-xylanase [Ruficoccus sp. ZRK36]|uniref:endo-1,4-beta-xylanase n=1 Tax=Ruficoccus sp. ZRK36 TaxID=2866311 RepID=UPI001C732878|nr:endo-1,4-beta-xylanase [Ruficoccus sp. ZRK36]QYY34386.1 hypothetical protein K0V07_08670 [Ruficoccus sp. ZRK36]